MKILWFQAELSIIKIKVEGKKVSMATSVHGLDYFFPVDTDKTGKFFSEKEKTEFDALKTEEEVVEAIIKEVKGMGYKLLLNQGGDKK